MNLEMLDEKKKRRKINLLKNVFVELGDFTGGSSLLMLRSQKCFLSFLLLVQESGSADITQSNIRHPAAKMSQCSGELQLPRIS